MNPFLAHILIITGLDVLGVLAAKMWYIHRNPWFILLTVLLFGGAGFVFARSLRFEGMAIANILWIALSIIAVTLIGFFGFKEEITTLQWAGIGLIATGLVFMNLNA